MIIVKVDGILTFMTVGGPNSVKLHWRTLDSVLYDSIASFLESGL